jgi:hypothetical protein
MKTQFDTQERNEISRRVSQVQQGKRKPYEDLESARSHAISAGRRFRESSDRKGSFSASASENYSRALREQAICEQVIQELDLLLKIAEAS